MPVHRIPVKFLGIFIVVCLFVGGNCDVTEKSATKKEIIGSWELLGMTKERFEIDEISKSDFIGGRLNLNADGTFTGEVAYPRKPENNLKISGTYTFENGILTISNKANGSTTQSRIEFQDDFMIGVPVNPDAFIAYYKKVR